MKTETNNKKYEIKIWADGEKINLTYNADEFLRFSKHIKSKRNDGSFNMDNGNIAEIIKIY